MQPPKQPPMVRLATADSLAGRGRGDGCGRWIVFGSGLALLCISLVPLPGEARYEDRWLRSNLVSSAAGTWDLILLPPAAAVLAVTCSFLPRIGRGATALLLGLALHAGTMIRTGPVFVADAGLALYLARGLRGASWYLLIGGFDAVRRGGTARAARWAPAAAGGLLVAASAVWVPALAGEPSAPWRQVTFTSYIELCERWPGWPADPFCIGWLGLAIASLLVAAACAVRPRRWLGWVGLGLALSAVALVEVPGLILLFMDRGMLLGPYDAWLSILTYWPNWPWDALRHRCGLWTGAILLAVGYSTLWPARRGDAKLLAAAGGVWYRAAAATRHEPTDLLTRAWDGPAREKVSDTSRAAPCPDTKGTDDAADDSGRGGGRV